MPISCDHPVTIRPALASDIPSLLQLELASFQTDRLSKRSFKYHIQSPQSLLLIAESESQLAGYGLVLLHQGTRLARLYSLAVVSQAKGRGLGRQLLSELELQAQKAHKLYMRLEVAESNQTAIELYRRSGYRIFGTYCDYYDDHSNALRMQKPIRTPSQPDVQQHIPWYRQSTEFTCGPSALMMAMASQSPVEPCLALELWLWREATTIFMTSGLGGCHPLGLALAAYRRGFQTRTFLTVEGPLFINGVRSENKKEILKQVDSDFKHQAELEKIEVNYQDIHQSQLQQLMTDGYALLMLISTYRLDSRKVPHWVVLTAMDDECIYFHDPDPEFDSQLPLDCQHVPIAKADFDRMSIFGSDRLRAAIAIRYKENP